MTQVQPFGLGVFLPIGKGGWIVSTESPRLGGSYDFNKRVTALTEKVGFDYAIAMAKWRGFGGVTQHWQ